MTVKNAWSANLAHSPGPLFCLGWLQDSSWILDLDCESRKTLRDFKAKLLFFTLMTQTPGVSRDCMASFGDFIMCLQFCHSLWMPIPQWVGRTRERSRSSTACAKAESRGTKFWKAGQLPTQWVLSMGPQHQVHSQALPPLAALFLAHTNSNS